jgi:hypothetical protein
MTELTPIQEAKAFNLLSVLTAVVVLSYLGTGIYALFTRMISWEVFSGAFGSPATMLLGYWVRGKDA